MFTAGELSSAVLYIVQKRVQMLCNVPKKSMDEKYDGAELYLLQSNIKQKGMFL